MECPYLSLQASNFRKSRSIIRTFPRISSAVATHSKGLASSFHVLM
jgi:hypothetical protein